MSVTYKMQDLPISVDLKSMSPVRDWGISIVMQDSNKDPVNIDKWEMYLVAKDGVNGKEYLSLSVGDGITRNLSEGAFAILATPTDTGGVDVPLLDYSIWVVDEDGVEETFYVGKIPVSQEA